VIGTTLSDRAAVSIEGIKTETAALSGLNMIAARLSPGAIEAWRNMWGCTGNENLAASPSRAIILR
jgi:hypothetical protein